VRPAEAQQLALAQPGVEGEAPQGSEARVRGCLEQPAGLLEGQRVAAGPVVLGQLDRDGRVVDDQALALRHVVGPSQDGAAVHDRARAALHAVEPALHGGLAQPVEPDRSQPGMMWASTISR
jgi:hypothetical protein